MRNALLTALDNWADPDQRQQAHRFLSGLSCDELQYIAEFLGASVLEPAKGCASRAQLAVMVAEFQRAKRCPCSASEDNDRKAILLLEYLCRAGVRRTAAHSPIFG